MKEIKFSNCSCGVQPGKFDINNINKECPATWQLISSGFTTGIFQLETRLGQEWARKVMPSNIEELAALTALIRPSCLESGMSEEYVDIKFGRKKSEYLHSSLKNILDPTYCCLVYQEQALKIATEIAGFSPETADELRKAIGKKKPELMASLKSKFIEGCQTKTKLSKEIAEQIFGWIEKSQRYSFNKSHAIAYGMLSYQTAWMKTHFPHEFFTSYLTYSSYKSDPKEEVYRLVQDARLFGVDIFPPDIRVGNTHFELTEKPYGIKFGLGHIRGVGQSAIEKITSAGQKSLGSWNQFLRSVPEFHKNVGIALIQSGACDCYNIDRARMILELETILGKSSRDKDGKKIEIRGLTNKEKEWFFTEFTDESNVKDILIKMCEISENVKPRLNSLKKNDLINVASKYTIDTANKNKQEIIGLLIENGYDDNENKKICANAERIKLIRDKIQVLENDIFDTNTGKAIAEKYFLGISLSASPADDADSSQASHTCLEIAKAANGSGITVCAIIDSVKPTKTKKGKAPGSKMCFLTISDSTYSLDHCVVFPDAFEEISQFCQENYICLFYGEKKNGSFIISNAKKLI